MSKNTPRVPHSEHVEAFGHAVGEIWKSMQGLSLPLPAVSSLQAEYLKEATALWNGAVERAPGDKPASAPAIGDRRFAANDWAGNAAAAFTAQTYLLNARTLMKLAEAVEGDAKTKARIRFAVQQWIDAASPSNYLALNPEAQRKALETKGESIAQGLKHLWQDIQQGHVSQTDESVFEVGRNVAELIRQVKAFQHVIATGEVTPSGWQPGRPTLTPGPELAGKVWKVWKPESAF